MTFTTAAGNGFSANHAVAAVSLKVAEVKSPDAFRTISEVANNLEVPQHVLRFWESKFQQIKPLKRGGGRRYYRPEDVVLLNDIKELLYTQGLTIRGVQKLLRDSKRPQCAMPSMPVAGMVKTSQAKASSVSFSPEKRREVEGVLEELRSLRELLRLSGV